MIKRLWALLLALCMTTATAAGYSDVSAQDWYGDAVDTVSQQGLMTGVGDGMFAPQAPVTRAMVVTVLYRMAGSPSAGSVTTFPDVYPGDWYCDAVAWAQNAGVASGYDNGTFAPKDTITREQLAVFLLRYAACQGTEIAQGVLGGYEDTSAISDWALDGMKHAVGAGLITGTERDTLEPKGVTTRAQLAVILCRMMIPVEG